MNSRARCGQQRRRAGGASRRRQDDAGAAGAARCAMGRTARRSSCWSRGGSRPAPAPNAWRGRSASEAGETVGYRVRFGSKISRATRIEVVTEGIFSRQILDDPELSGVAAVLFDEFHERSLDADLGLALARDAQTGLRDDLRILVMSATLDGARVGKLLGDAPVVDSEGRAFPVETRYLGRKADAPIERQMADAIATRCAPIPAQCWLSCRAPPKSAAPRPCCANGFTMRASRSSPLFGALDAACRTVPSRRRRREAQGRAGDLDRRDVADHRGRAHRGRLRPARVPRYEPDMGLTGSRPCGPRAPRSTSAAAAPAAPSPACATGCGTSRRPRRSRPYTQPEISRPTFARWCSISRNGACAIPPRWRFSIRRPRRR